MIEYPYYRVEISHGKIGKQKHQDAIFKNKDLKMARNEALSFAFKTEGGMEDKFDSPSLIKEIPEFNSILIAFSLTVTLDISDLDQFIIYGAESLQELLEELNSEAAYFVKHKQIAKKDLKIIFQNLEGNGKPYQIATSDNKPDFEYEKWEALPFLLNKLLNDVE